MKTPKTARTMYLYADGHAVIVHEKYDADAGRIEWATLHAPDEVNIDVRFRDGRLLINKQAIPMILLAKSVHALAANIADGTQYTKDLNLAVETVLADYGMGDMLLTSIPSLMTGDIKYQHGHGESWEQVKDLRRWADMHVAQKGA